MNCQLIETIQKIINHFVYFIMFLFVYQMKLKYTKCSISMEFLKLTFNHHAQKISWGKSQNFDQRQDNLKLSLFFFSSDFKVNLLVQISASPNRIFSS